MWMEALREHTGKGVPAAPATSEGYRKSLSSFSVARIANAKYGQGEGDMSSPADDNKANNHKINYVEFVSTDIARSRHFYSDVFGWSFQDWGPDYISFSAPGTGIDGGFLSGETLNIGETAGSPLIVLYAVDLAATEQAIIAAGGKITVPTFEFPGGRRFHFSDGAGNVLAVWSE
jgi:uncharacterized protein